MNPAVLVLGAVLFAASLASHVMTWRLRRPKNDIIVLFIMFFDTPFFALLVLGWLGRAHGWLALSWAEIGAAYLLHAALSAAYIQTYPCAQAASPSLEILLRAGARPEGLTEEELSRGFGAASLVGSRFEDLKSSGFVLERGGKYALSPAAEGLVKAFIAYRKFLGLEVKGG